MRVINLAISIEIATQSTLHKSLMWLKNHNFINIIRSEKDSRDKIVLITRKGKNYLGGL
jgi:DNA-binding MarR family transcriptional regulator